MKFWHVTQCEYDKSILYIDISIKYIAVEIYGYYWGVTF